jgi:hypothetical protein
MNVLRLIVIGGSMLHEEHVNRRPGALTNLPRCGKVVSTKVGCGRFDGKRSRVAPALALRGHDDGANFQPRRPNNAQKHRHWRCCFTDMCASDRAGRKSDAGAPLESTD